MAGDGAAALEVVALQEDAPVGLAGGLAAVPGAQVQHGPETVSCRVASSLGAPLRTAGWLLEQQCAVGAGVA